MMPTTKTEDEDLEALFDSIAATSVQNEKSPAPSSDKAESGVNTTPFDKGDLVTQLGQMTRVLHDTLRELGLSDKIGEAVASIPDARDRLSYIATLTQQAADRVLNATEAAQPVVLFVESEAQHLADQWTQLLDKKMDVDQFKELALQTHCYLTSVPPLTKSINAYLTEIMMAQDFQDLTGQVIKKVVEVTQNMERQMLALLVENASPQAQEPSNNLLNGPVIKFVGKTDVVSNQDEVDGLLESMGF